jgi:hypothetical protein
MNEYKKRTCQMALPVITSWLHSNSDGWEFFRDDYMERGEQAAADMIVGLTNLAGILLIEAANGQQERAVEILQEVALKIDLRG